MAQGHGGALKPGGTPEGRSQGGRVTAERRRARVERTEAIDDAMVGSGFYIEGSLSSSGTLTATATDAVGHTGGRDFEIEVTGGEPPPGCEA